MARAVPAVVSSPVFLRLWRTALNGAHSQLLLILRGCSHLLTITGSALTVNVPMAARILLNAGGLPRQLDRRRRRALLVVLIPVAALAILGALGVRLLTHAAGSPLVTAATSALTAPLTSQLKLTSALCAAAVAFLLATSRLVPTVIQTRALRPPRAPQRALRGGDRARRANGKGKKN